MIKTLFYTLFISLFLFACQSNADKHSGSNGSDAESIEHFKPTAEEADLSEYEYVCNHCKIGSHEKGECPCGMEYKKNPDFVAENTTPKE